MRGLAAGMAPFLIDVRIHTATSGGWQGARDMPTFYVVGGTMSDAAANARTILRLREGDKLADGAYVTRYTLDVIPADPSDEYDTYMWDSAEHRDPAASTVLMPFRWQHADASGYVIDDEDNAHSATAWDGAHGDTCIVAVERTRTGRWAIVTGGDYGHTLPLSVYRRRFDSPTAALGYVAERWNRVPVPAVCRCDTGGACD